MLRPLSALEAIDPAWQHTRRFLLPPGGRKSTLFKLAAMAFFAEIGGCSTSFNRSGDLARHLPTSVAAALTAFFLLVAVITFLLVLAFFYIGSRFQFVRFDAVLRSDRVIAPIWRRFGPLTWRWMGLKLLCLLAFFVALLPFLVPATRLLLNLIRNGSGDADNLGALFASFLGVIAGFFVLTLVFGIAYTAVRDFALPSLALEGTSIVTALGRVWRLFRNEPGQLLLFLLMRFVIGLAWTMAAYVLLLVTGLLLCLPLGALSYLLWRLHQGGAGAAALAIAGWIALGTLLAAYIAAAFITLFGALSAFVQAYVVYFLAGRYPLLGEILVQSFTPPPPATPDFSR